MGLAVHSTSRNCKAPEMLTMLVRNAHPVRRGISTFLANRIPAAMPIATYPIRTGREWTNAARKTRFVMRIAVQSPVTA